MRDDVRMSTRVHNGHGSQRSGAGGGGGGTTARNTRPLGAVRATNSLDTSTSVPRFPPLATPRTDRLQLQAGIHGNAMTVPPQKLAHEALKSEERAIHNSCSHGTKTPTSSSPGKRVVGSSKSDSTTHSNKSDDAAALEKARGELKESMVRERELKQEIIQLRKDIDELKQQIWDKDKIIKDLQEQFIRQEEKYKELYEKEQSQHNETKKRINFLTTQLAESKMEMSKLALEHQKEMDTVKLKHDVEVSELQAEKAREISIRDEKLNKLKKQMADALQGNSWERQQQLDELSKELNKVQEEADMLRMRLKATKHTKQGGCSNCDALATQLSQAQKLAKEKDSTIQELSAKCRKYEKPTPRLDAMQKQSSRGKIK